MEEKQHKPNNVEIVKEIEQEHRETCIKQTEPIKLNANFQYSLFNRDEATMLKKKREQERLLLKEELEKQIQAKKSIKEKEEKKKEEELLNEQKIYDAQFSNTAKPEENTTQNIQPNPINTEITVENHPTSENVIQIINQNENPTEKEEKVVPQVHVIQAPIISEIEEPKEQIMEDNSFHNKLQSINANEWEDMKKKIDLLNNENEQLKHAISNIRERKNQSQEKLKPSSYNQKRIKISASANQKTVYERKKKEQDFMSEIEALENINNRIQKANERKQQLQSITRAQKIQNIKSAGRNIQKLNNSKIPLKQYIASQQRKDATCSFTGGRNLDTVCHSEWVYPNKNPTPPAEFEDELDLLIKNYGGKGSPNSVYDQAENSKTHSASIHFSNAKLQSPVLASAGSMSTVPSDTISKIGKLMT